MFINFWYVAAQSSEIIFGADRPRKVQMLGQKFALWRDTKGDIQCVSDVCSHRSGALGDGRIRGNCVECPYHGWTFDGEGNCVRLPSLGPDAKIPDRTRIDAYPVVEKYGLVHVFLGDLPEEERPPIIDIPECDDPEWRSIIYSDVWEIDYKRSVENTIDPAHNEFTHPTHGFLGMREDYKTEEFDLIDEEWGTGLRNRMFAPPLANQEMREASGKQEGTWINGGIGTFGPHCTWTHIDVNEKFQMHNFLLHTPIHETLDRWYLVATRSNLLDPRYDQTIAERSVYIASQDKYVLEPLNPKLTPRTAKYEFLVPADKAIARYREYCADWEAKGWRIDIDQLRADRDRIAYTIPSPARRKKKGWVLPAVPLIPGQEAKAEKAAG